MEWVIYTLNNPRNHAVRYVGITQTPKRRFRDHIKDALRPGKRPVKDEWVACLAVMGLRPEFNIIQRGSGEGWEQAERYWIRHYRDLGAALVNGTVGGQGVSGWGSPEERKEHARNRWAKQTPEHTALMHKNRWAKSPDERAESARKREASISPEKKRERQRQGNANKTPEQRSAAVKMRWDRMTPQERSDWAKKRAAAKTPEERRLIAMKREAAKRAIRLSHPA